MMATVMRSLVLLIIIVAMNFNVTLLRVSVNESPWSRDTLLTYTRMKQFEGFRLAFISYLLLPVVFITIEVRIRYLYFLSVPFSRCH